MYKPCRIKGEACTKTIGNQCLEFPDLLLLQFHFLLDRIPCYFLPVLSFHVCIVKEIHNTNLSVLGQCRVALAFVLPMTELSQLTHATETGILSMLINI